jgi:putative glutamine amidotransferase
VSLGPLAGPHDRPRGPDCRQCVVTSFPARPPGRNSADTRGVHTVVVHVARIGISSSPVVHEDRHVDSVNTAYVEAVVAAGGLPVVLPVLDPELAAATLDGLDGLLLSGGGDIDPARYGEEPVPEVYGVDERRDAFELALVDVALERNTPTLGICRGHQVLNVALGGRMLQHVGHLTSVNHQERERFGEVIHTVLVEPGSLVASVLGATVVGVNTLHHQAVAEPGRGLRVVARSADDALIEAVEHEDRRTIGVQWHPELLQHRPQQRRLFNWLVEQADQRRRLGRGHAPDVRGPLAPDASHGTALA